jgi:hypothetical protein
MAAWPDEQRIAVAAEAIEEFYAALVERYVREGLTLDAAAARVRADIRRWRR